MKWNSLLARKKKDALGKSDIFVLIVGLGIFAALSLGNITRWSVWFDEAFGVYMIRFNFFDIARYTASDVHPPFYYWILKLWTMMFGTSELALRSMSLVAMMAAFVFVYLIVRRAFTVRIAAGGLFMMAVSPLLIRYSEEARMYGLVSLIVASATYVFLKLLEKPTKRRWIIYGILVSLGMWTHYFTALMWLAHWVYRFTILYVPGKSIRNMTKSFFSKDWLYAHMLAVGLFLPWLPFMAKQLSSVQGGGFWIPPVTLATPANFGADMLLYQLAEDTKGWLAVLVWVVLVGIMLLSFAIVPRLARDEKKIIGLFAAMAIVPTGLLILASMPPLRPAFIDRYIIMSVASVFILLGIILAKGVSSAKTRLPASIIFLGAVLVTGIGVSHVYSTGNYNIVTKDPLPIRQTMQLAQAHAQEGEPFVAQSVWRYYETHYYQTDRNQVYLQAEDNLKWGSYEMVRYNTYHKVQDVGVFARQHGGKIWFVGDWKYGEPKLPHSGSWKILRELRVDGVSDDTSTIRAVELQVQ